MSVIPLECPSCGTELILDSDDSAAICSSCGKPFVVKEAIVQSYIKLVTARKEDSEKSLICEEFSREDGVLKRYHGSSSIVVIPDNVTVIGSKAFENCRGLTEVHFSDSVAVIEENAFSGCADLCVAEFTDAVRKIGRYAFSECTSLRTLKLPHGIEEIGPHAFDGCYNLSMVKMPSSKSNIHETVFTGDEELQFEWPDDWSGKILEKIRIVAPTVGGMIDLSNSAASSLATVDSLLYMGTSDQGMFRRFHFYIYSDFMNLFSLQKNNNDPYILRMSVDTARERYEDIADIQRSYSELISLLDRAHISRNRIEQINIPHFVWKQGKGLNDYKIVNAGSLQVFRLKLSK